VLANPLPGAESRRHATQGALESEAELWKVPRDASGAAATDDQSRDRDALGDETPAFKKPEFRKPAFKAHGLLAMLCTLNRSGELDFSSSV